MKILIALLLLLVGGAVGAANRPLSSCEKAPLLPVFQKQLPDHILAETADKKPRIISEIPHISGPIFRRSGTSLACIVIALDATGKVETAEVSYPIGVKLTAQEREQLIATKWSPAEQKDQHLPSLVSMAMTSSIR